MSKQITVHLVDAFTDTPGKGNRAGVVMDATDLTTEEMQAVAALVNVSETAFMIPTPDEVEYNMEVRYFTPTTEVPSCGHATIAAHHVRSGAIGAENGRIMVKTGAGILPVDIATEEGVRKVLMTQGEIVFTPPYADADRDMILDALGLTPNDLMDGLPVQEVSTGHSKVMVPIQSVEKLDSLTPDMDALVQASQKIGCNGFFVFAINGEGDECLTSGRMFAPAIGIDEDPVTGNGNGPCGAYLSHHDWLLPIDSFAYLGRQGRAMGKEGIIGVIVQRDADGPKTIQVGGTAVEADEMVLDITDTPDGVVAKPLG